MRKLLPVLLFLPLLFSCEKLPEAPQPKPQGTLLFEDGTSSKEFEFLEFERIFAVNLKGFYHNTDVSLPDWISLLPESNDRFFKFHVSKNATAARREGVITITEGNERISVKINQIGALMDGSIEKALRDIYSQCHGSGWYNETMYGTKNWLASENIFDWQGISSPCIETEYDYSNPKNYKAKDVYYGTDNILDIIIYGPDILEDKIYPVPDKFWDIAKYCRALFLESRKFTGDAGDKVWNKNLEQLYLNNINVNIDGIEVCENLKTIKVHCNKGRLDDKFSKLKMLISVFIIGNSKTVQEGYLPQDLELPNLESLSIWNMNLSGSIPAGLFNSKNLSFLDLSNNKLTGEIPDEITKLSNLRSFNIAGNRITAISEKIGMMRGIEFLYINDNRIQKLPQFYRFFPANDGYGWPDQPDAHGMCANYPYSAYNEQGQRFYYATPRWFTERYRNAAPEKYGDANAIYNDVRTDNVYPYASDLEFPANEYFFDGKEWTHKNYGGLPARNIHKVDGEWVYDPTWDWYEEVYPIVILPVYNN